MRIFDVFVCCQIFQDILWFVGFISRLFIIFRYFSKMFYDFLSVFIGRYVIFMDFLGHYMIFRVFSKPYVIFRSFFKIIKDSQMLVAIQYVISPMDNMCLGTCPWFNFKLVHYVGNMPRDKIQTMDKGQR